VTIDVMEDLSSELIDLSAVSLTELVRLSTPELTSAIRATLASAENGGGEVQGQVNM
jgi:hypothetical protein